MPHLRSSRCKAGWNIPSYPWPTYRDPITPFRTSRGSRGPAHFVASLLENVTHFILRTAKSSTRTWPQGGDMWSFFWGFRNPAKTVLRTGEVWALFYDPILVRMIWWLYMNVSENSGTPKSSILIGFSIIDHPFWGTTIFGNTHM